MSYRPYVNGASQTGTSLITDGWPVSTTGILLQDDIIRIEGYATEYTVAADVNSNGTGQATITLTSALSSSPADNSPVLVPSPRPLTTEMRTKIVSKKSDVIYFVMFDFDEIYRLGNIVTYSAGTKIQVTSEAHGLSNGASITIDLPDEYAGTYTISEAESDPDTFVVDGCPFDADADTEGTSHIDAPVYVTTTTHDIPWDSKTWQGIGGLLYFESIQESQDMKANATIFKMSGVDPSILTLLLSKAFIGRDVKTWIAHINLDGTILCDPIKDLIMLNQMSGGFTIEENVSKKNTPGTVTITGRMEDILASSEIIVGIQTNPTSHQRFYPDDRFFEEIPKLINKQIKFGKLDVKSGKSGCFFWVALTFTISQQVLYGYNILEPIRWYRDTKMDISVDKYYKSISPLIISGIEKYPCKIFVYQWIQDFTIKLSNFVSQGQYLKAEIFYNKGLKILEKFIE